MPLETRPTSELALREDARFPRVTLVPPSPAGYIQLAAEVDRRPALLPPSRLKRRLLARCRRLCATLEADPRVVEAHVFEAVLVPPGRGRHLRRRPDIRVGRYDLAVLVTTTTPEDIEPVRASDPYKELEHRVRTASRSTHVVTATNARRIGPVDHDRQGIFLFNYFVADDTARNLAVWEWTAGWFQQETGLDNSTVLLPREPDSNYRIINHCRWDRLVDVLPALLFKPSFRRYVLANFATNGVAAVPVLYRLA